MRCRLLTLLAACAALTAPARPALAQAAPPAAGPGSPAADTAGLASLPLDALLDMPVTGASRFTQRRSQASSAVTVIHRAELLALGHRSLADALASVRGVAVASDRIYHYLGVRGTYAPGDFNTRVLLLVDGNRVNDALYDQAFLGTEFPLDLDEVERIEFIAGQGAAVYGGNALLGVVNVITREGPRRAEGSGGLRLGRDGERALRAGLRLPLAAGALQLSASRLRHDGGAVHDAASGAWLRGVDGTQRDAAYLRWDHAGFTTSLLHAERRKAVPLGVDLVNGDPLNRYRDRQTLINAEQRWSLAPETTLTGRGFAGAYDFIGDYRIDYPPPTHNRDIARARWYGAEARVNSSALAGHRLVAGVELQRSTALRQINEDLAPLAAGYLDDRRDGWRAALYAEDQWQLAPQWALHLGLRLDRQDGLATQTSPRLAAVWQPDARWSLKAVHGRAFRAPNAFEAHYRVDAVAGYEPTPGLRLEHVTGSELVAEWQPAPAWRLSGSLYRNRASDLLQLVYDTAIDRWRYSNGSALTSRGAELELEHATERLRWRLNASLADSRGDPALAVYPRRQLKGTAVLPLPADWTLGLELAATARRAAAPGQAVAHATLRGPLPLGDGRLAPALTLSLRNLADRALLDPGTDAQLQPTVPLPGRHWWLGLSWPVGR